MKIIYPSRKIKKVYQKCEKYVFVGSQGKKYFVMSFVVCLDFFFKNINRDRKRLYKTKRDTKSCNWCYQFRI